MRLLQASNLMELIQTVFDCFEHNSRKPLNVETKGQSKRAKPDLLDMGRRLYGIIRLLEQMYDPIMNASSHVADLLGRTFFMPFALTTLSILARTRVLVLECLDELLTIFNHFSKWASTNKGLHDPNLPISVSCKWDGRRISLAVTSANHQQAVHAGDLHNYLENENGHKYTIFDASALGLGPLGDNDVQLVETNSESMVEKMESTELLLKEQVAYDDTGLINNSTNVIDTNSETEKQMPFLSQDQSPPKQAAPLLMNELLSEANPKASDETVSMAKSVAYFSVSSMSDVKLKKITDYAPSPPKRQKKDSLFDMLLGLGDELS
ncbi:hypothetical protein KP509_36G029900 [Ceratopteris richardii]|nr:hypothetical protein KP509_36G029900 [Ceratopteris richardii]